MLRKTSSVLTLTSVTYTLSEDDVAEAVIYWLNNTHDASLGVTASVDFEVGQGGLREAVVRSESKSVKELE